MKGLYNMTIQVEQIKSTYYLGTVDGVSYNVYPDGHYA